LVSFDVRQKLRIAAAILALIAAAAPHAGFSQAALDTGAADEQQRIVDEILKHQTQDGPHSSELIEPLTALGLLYQESGDDDLAIATIERALQVIRANYGLRSLEQAPLIRQSIYVEEARGNIPAAWQREQELLALARRHRNDLDTVPILREIAERRMDVLNRYVAGEFPPQIALGCYYHNDIGSCTAGSRGVAVRTMISGVWKTHIDAIGVILRHRHYASTDLLELEMELIHSSYEYSNYTLGKQSLRRLLSYGAANSEPWLSRMDTLVQIADWDLLYGHYGPAFDTYQQAYAELKRKDVPPGSIAAIFSPQTPAVLPTSLPNPLISNETAASTGYIDVAFKISKYGKSRRVKILDTTTNATNADKRQLTRLILRSRYRPQMTDGQFARTAPIVMRYYLEN
jgi:tetratricopeptide (TPR) repeat protein